MFLSIVGSIVVGGLLLIAILGLCGQYLKTKHQLEEYVEVNLKWQERCDSQLKSLEKAEKQIDTLTHEIEELGQKLVLKRLEIYKLENQKSKYLKTNHHMQVKEIEGAHRKCYHAKNNGMDELSAEIQSLKSQLALTQATLGELIVNGVEDLKEKNSYIEILQITMKDLEAKVAEQREEIEEIEEIEISDLP